MEKGVRISFEPIMRNWSCKDWVELRDSDFEWIEKHYFELYDKYGGCWLAVHDKTVVGTYQSELDAYVDVEKSYPTGSFTVVYCDGMPHGYMDSDYAMWEYSRWDFVRNIFYEIELFFWNLPSLLKRKQHP